MNIVSFYRVYNLVPFLMFRIFIKQCVVIKKNEIATSFSLSITVRCFNHVSIPLQ